MEISAAEIVSKLADASSVYHKCDSESGIMYVGKLTYSLFAALKRKFELWKGVKPVSDHIRITPNKEYAVWYEQDKWGLQEVA